MAATIAIAAAGAVGHKIVLERKLGEVLSGHGATVGSLTVGLLGRVQLRDLVLPVENGSSLRIATIDGRPRLPFLNGTVTATGIKAEMRDFELSLPLVVVDDANLDRELLEIVFGGGLPLAQRLEQITIGRVSAPEIRLNQRLAGTRQHVTYENVVLEGIDRGLVQRYSSARVNVDATLMRDEDGNLPEELSASIGSLTIDDINVAYLARLYTEHVPSGERSASPVYGQYSARDIVFRAGQARTTFQEIRSSGFSMRMPDHPLLEILETLNSTEKLDALTRIASVLDMLAKADMELIGLKLASPLEATEEQETLAVDRISLKMDNARLDASVHGLSAVSGEDTFEVREATLSGFSWGQSLDALKKLLSLDSAHAEAFPYGSLLPEFGTLRLAGLQADLAADDIWQADESSASNRDAAASGPERAKFSIGAYELALTKPFNGIPTYIRIAYEDFDLPLPDNSNEELFTGLKSLGYDRLSFSANVEASWDGGSRNLNVEDVSLQTEKMGSIKISGLLGNVSEDLFIGDEAARRFAALGITTHELKMEIEELGLIERGVKHYARENSQTEAAVRGQLALGATFFLYELGGNHSELQKVASAFTHFLTKPGKFSLSLKAKSRLGVGAFEMMSTADTPANLLDEFDIQVKTE